MGAGEFERFHEQGQALCFGLRFTCVDLGHNMALPVVRSQVLKYLSHGLLAITGEQVLVEDTVSIVGV